MRRFGKEKYRVIQWATGHQGRLQIEMAASENRPHLELVGCWVHSQKKIGADAGTLAGIAPVGVKATNDVDALLAMEADCVVYSPFFQNVDVMCRILASDKSIVTQLLEIYLVDEAKRAKIQAACEMGGTSFYCTGINPGFMSDRLVATLTSLNSEVEHMRCLEYSPELPNGLSDHMLFEGIGFGWTQERLDKELPQLFSGTKLLFFSSGDFVAAALGLKIDERKREIRFAMLPHDIEVYGRTLKAGTVGAVSPTFRMFVNGKERIELTQCWKIHPSMPLEWGFDSRPKSFEQIRITGKPSYEFFWEPLGDPMTDAVTATAATVVNSIPFVCDAPPGIHTQIDLPMISFSGELT